MGYIPHSVHDRNLIAKRRAAIMAYMEGAPSPRSARQIADALGFTISDTNNDLNRLMNICKIVKPGWGLWEVARG